MKNSILPVLALVTLAFAGSAHAELIENIRTSSLYQFELDSSLVVASADALSGVLRQNETDQTVTLKVLAGPDHPILVAQELPIVSVRTGECNETITIAQRDLDTLILVDNSTNTCRYKAPLPPLEVAYSTGGTRHTVSKFYGELLQTSYLFKEEF